MNLMKDIYDIHKHIGERRQYLFPPKDMQTDRIAWIRGEVDELEEAMIKAVDATDRLNVLQETIDIIYFALGVIWDWNFTPMQFYRAWREVHRANMDKQPPARKGGKWIKPPGWKKADVFTALNTPVDEFDIVVTVRRRDITDRMLNPDNLKTFKGREQVDFRALQILLQETMDKERETQYPFRPLNVEYELNNVMHRIYYAEEERGKSNK